MRKNYFYIIYTAFALAIASISFYGCDFTCDKKSVEFSLPQWDSSIGYELEYWFIKVFDGENEKTIIKGNKNRSFYLQCSFDQVSAILAYPVTNVDFDTAETFFSPCGCIYPYQNSLTYLHGFSADVLYKFYTGSDNKKDASQHAKKFNWQKFIQTLEQKSLESQKNDESYFFYNPWNCEVQKIIYGIQNASFSATYLNQTKSNFKEFSVLDIQNAFDDNLKSFCQRGGISYDKINFSVFVSPYIPENINGGKFIYPCNKQQKFLCGILNGSVITIFLNLLENNFEITLAINPTSI